MGAAVRKTLESAGANTSVAWAWEPRKQKGFERQHFSQAFSLLLSRFPLPLRSICLAVPRPFYLVLPDLADAELPWARGNGTWPWRWPEELAAWNVAYRSALPAPYAARSTGQIGSGFCHSAMHVPPCEDRVRRKTAPCASAVSRAEV